MHWPNDGKGDVIIYGRGGAIRGGGVILSAMKLRWGQCKPWGGHNSVVAPVV